MSKLAELAAQREAAKETAANMTEVTKGGGTARLLPAGPAIVRMVSYIEFGNQPQSFNGVAKAPKPEIQLGFAVYGPQYQNEDGTPYIIYPYKFSLDQNEKAKAVAIFKCMNWQGNATHFSDFLGQAFIGKIVHEPKSRADQTIVSRLDLKGFLPPRDAMSGQPYAVPEARDEDISWFFWDQPTLASWNTLYREGQFDDGASKNRIQETIAAATNFAGSPLEALLAQNGMAVPVAKPKAATAQGAALPGVQAALPSAGGTPVAAPLPPTGSAPIHAAPVVSLPSTGVAPAPVISAPIVPAMTFPSSPALPKVG